MSETGWAAVPRWIVRDTSIPVEHKLIWMVLSDYSGEKGICWPSQDTLASQVGMSVRTLQRRLNEMREAGLIEVVCRSGPKGRRNYYRLLHDRLSATPSLVSPPPDTPDTPGSPITSPVSSPITSPVSYEEEAVEEQPLSFVTSSSNADSRPEPLAHDRQSMTPSWVPSVDFRAYLRATYDVDLGASLIRFRAYQIDNNRYSRCWENSFEGWVVEDDRRQRAEREQGTDDLGVPLTQRKTSAYGGALQPGDEGYVDPESLWPGQLSVTETEQQSE